MIIVGPKGNFVPKWDFSTNLQSPFFFVIAGLFSLKVIGPAKKVLLLTLMHIVVSFYRLPFFHLSFSKSLLSKE